MSEKELKKWGSKARLLCVLNGENIKPSWNNRCNNCGLQWVDCAKEKRLVYNTLTGETTEIEHRSISLNRCYCIEWVRSGR
jgi:hypothetical protein